MTHSSDIQFTIHFNDPDFDAEERDEEVQKLLNQIRDLDKVTASRVLDPNPPPGNKALGGFLVGRLAAEAKKVDAKQVLGFLGDRLSGKTIELKVEANGKKLEVKVNSQAELKAAMEMAQAFIAA